MCVAKGRSRDSPARLVLLGYRPTGSCWRQSTKVADSFIPIALTRLGRCIEQSISRHHTQVTDPTNPVVDTMGPSFEINELGPAPTGNQKSWCGFVTITSVMVIHFEDVSQIHPLFQFTCVQIKCMGLCHKSFFHGPPCPDQMVDHEDVFPGEPQTSG